MSWGKLLSGITEIAVYIKRTVVKVSKDNYESNRKSSPNKPADTFERNFGAGGLHDKPVLHPDKTTDGNRG